jgi:signal transduction histidine kinase
VEEDRVFTPLEVKMAEVMARRLSFVVARKKILAMFRINEKKEAIVHKIFRKIGGREGVKMKEVFNRVVPELADIISLQSCALFSVTEDDENVILEAGYPEKFGYHGIGKTFPIRSEPAFELVLKRRTYDVETPFEVVTPSYVLIMDPQRSGCISWNLKNFAAAHNMNSILYVPLDTGEEITHFMAIDALDQRQRYTEGEIEIFLFLGRELMKAQRMERLDDILHDFKNPAIATAGFARRLKKLIEQEESLKNGVTMKKYADILLEETSRLQEMALSIYQAGKEQVVNLTAVLLDRFEINKEVIREILKQNVTLHEGPFDDPLYVQCYPLHLERILDNLLNNATNAIPLKGGILAIRTYAHKDMACVEISNTGGISEEERLRLLEGEGRGRGLYITHRIVRLIQGRIDVKTGINSTAVTVQIPLHKT